MSKKKDRQRYRRRKKGPVKPMLLTAYNYKWLLSGVLCVLVGFGGMYIEGQQFGIFALYIAPVLVLAGFVLVAISVFRTDPGLDDKNNNRTDTTEQSSTTT